MAVQGDVFGEVWGEVFGEVFGLVWLGHSEPNKLQPMGPRGLHSKVGENSGKNFMTRSCRGTPDKGRPQASEVVVKISLPKVVKITTCRILTTYFQN